MNKKVLFSIREFVVILLSGGLPLLLAYDLGGLDELDATISGLIAPDLFLFYCCGLPVIFGAVYIADRFVYINPLSKKKAFVNFVISTLFELSTNIVGIFRLACGVLMTFPFLVLFVESQLFTKVFLNFFPYGLMGGLEVTILYWFLSKIELKQSF